MTATRIRKKGCPFCKARPDDCAFVWDRSNHESAIGCLVCGSTGPVSVCSGWDKTAMEIQSEAWSKWNGRG